MDKIRRFKIIFCIGERVINSAERFVYRGGNWNNGANAGVFSLNGNNARSNRNWNIGFRAALA